jgi:hypothetical protein
MGFVKFGGFVVTTKKDDKYFKRQQVDEQTLLKIAKALGIPVDKRAMLASEFTSIFIYRGTDSPPPKDYRGTQPPKKKKSP